MLIFQKRVSEIDSQIASATTAIRAEKEASDALASQRQEQIQTLTADAEKARKEADTKHSIGMRWKTRAETLIAEANTRTQTLAARDQTIAELNSKVESLTQELEGSKTKIEELEKKVAEAEKSASDKEATVQRLQGELSKAQSGQTSAPAASSGSADTAQLVSISRG